VIDGERIYHVDAGANLFAFDINTGKEPRRKLVSQKPLMRERQPYHGTNATILA
jgi:outer membrane protein assembly factor BamB